MNIIRRILAAAVSLSIMAAAVPAVRAAQGNTPPAQPIGLLTNELEQPLNVEGAPYFSWLLQDEDDNEVQTAYQIVVTDAISKEEVWDSDQTTSTEQSYVAYAGPALEEAHPYTWKVRTWDKDGEPSPYSEESEFATGLTDDSWNASWIAPANAKGKNIFWHTRKEQPLAEGKAVTRALAYVAGCHDYELNINGVRLGRGQSFDYPDMTDYQAWDITEAVGGSSSIAVGILARWYGGGQGRAPGQIGLLAHIKLFYEDGTTEVIATDDTWKTAAAPFYGETARNGEGDFVEKYDAQKQQENWTRTGYNDSAWTQAAELGVHPSAPFTHVEAELGHVTEYEVKPVSVHKIADGSTVADFGKVIPARLLIHFENGTAGNELAIQTGYEVDNSGAINTNKTSLQDTDMRFVYTQKDGEQTYHSWDHLGFRYVQIPAGAGQDFTEEDISALVVHAEVPRDRDTHFSSSNEMLNQVYELMKRSSLYSAQNSFVDTPTREKGQFLDDGTNISAATTTTWYERTTTKKALLQFLDSADRYWNEGNDLGRYNAVYPNSDGKRDIPEYSIDFPVWVWRYYMQTGDRDLLEKAYPYMKNTADYITRNIATAGASAGLVTAIEGGSSSYLQGIVDWPASGRFGYDWNGTKDGVRTTINALSVRTFDTIAAMAMELGEESEATDLQAKAQSLRNAMNEKLINSAGVYSDGLNKDGNQVSHAGQHSTSYALAFDIAPDEKKQHMADYVAGMGMRQGPMTADILAESLFDTGLSKDALKLFTNSNDYGWAMLADRGYTFTWESWGDGSKATDSQSHGWGSAAARLILEHFAGVTVTEAGAKKIMITPAYGVLDSVDASVMTERGRVGVAYSGRKAEFEMTVSVPVNVQAQIVLPQIGTGEFIDADGAVLQSEMSNGSQVVTVGSGTYHLIYDGEATTAVTIENPEGIRAHAVIGGRNYPLPMQENIASDDMGTLQVVSDDENYTFAYFTGDVVSAHTPPVNLLEDSVSLLTHFKYQGVPTGQDTATLHIGGSEGTVRINGIEQSIPYDASFVKGTELTVEPVAPEGKVFTGFTGDGLIGTPALVVMNSDIQADVSFAENGEIELVSKGKAVTASSSLENDSWGKAKLTDGMTTGTGYSSNDSYNSADVSANPPYVEIDLGSVMPVDSVVLYPRTDESAIKAGHYMFPQDFSVAVSEDGNSGTYQTVQTVTGAADDALPDKITFDTVNTRYVRVTFTKLCEDTTLGNRRLQLAEMEVYSGEVSKTLVHEIVLGQTDVQLALGDTITLSASVLPVVADEKEVEWLVHDIDGEGYGAVSKKAELVTRSGGAEVIPLEAGTVDVVARARDGSGVIAICRVDIVSLGNKVTIDKSSVTKEALSYDVTVSGAGTLFTAVYSQDGELLTVKTDGIQKRTSLKKTIPVAEMMTEGVTKFMLWDSGEDMKPISVYAQSSWDLSRPDMIWDLRSIVSSRTTMNTFENNTKEYEGIWIVGGGESDYLDPQEGFYTRGKSGTGAGANRYIKYTAPYDGVMEITAKRSYSGASLWVTTSAQLSGGAVVEHLSNNDSFATGSVPMEEGATYYFYCVGSGMTMQSLRFSAAY